MAVITEKGATRQTFLIIVLVIMAVIVGVYLYSTRKPALAPTAPGATIPEVGVPEGVVPGLEIPGAEEVKPPERISPEAMSPERIAKILKKLGELDLVLYGKLPIEVDSKEIGRANPFVPHTP